ncbi:MAG: thioredoxin domain-containing protein [Nitrospirota bacterium]|nr:thioredoxin domain-containing protein [Nitrospirota bacterium]
MVKSRGWQGRLVGMMVVTAALGFAGAAWAGKAELKGRFEILKDEVSTHKSGKVQLVEFADFYCPHCHRFDGEGVPLLEKEFGKKLDVTMVGYPVMPGKLPTAFDMYEQAKTMGKGDEMKRVLFRIIHKDKVGIIDRTIRELLIREVGLDPVAFEAGLASAKPARAFEEGRKWGDRIKVQQTPTVLLDGNIKVEQVDPDNLKVVIQSILDGDVKK